MSEKGNGGDTRQEFFNTRADLNAVRCRSVERQRFQLRPMSVITMRGWVSARDEEGKFGWSLGPTPRSLARARARAQALQLLLVLPE